MKIVVQRVAEASVTVGDDCIASIGRGLLLLVGVEKGDTATDSSRAADKIASLRLFPDAGGRMNLDLAAVGGEILAVSQFTLAGSIAKGRRPGFDGAMDPEPAARLFDDFVRRLRAAVPRVETGAFGADMKVQLINDGPVTFIYEARSSTSHGKQPVEA